VDQPRAQLTTPEGLLERAYSQWAASCRNVRVSQLHRDVAEVVRKAGMPFAIEHLTEDRLFSIDIALTVEKIGIEVNGPTHYMANKHEPLGEHVARQKLLEARGWAVVSIPYFQWSNQTAEYRTNYLLQEIHAARQRQYSWMQNYHQQ